MSVTRSNQLLRQARRMHTWSQGDLAERIGVAKETISRWENGVSRPQPQQLYRLCETFQTTPDALGYALDGDEEYPPQPDPAPENISAAEDAVASPAKRHILARRNVLIAGGTALSGIILVGGTLGWFLSQSQPMLSPRHWPTVAYDISHHNALARVVQWMLKARGYDVGPTSVDGVFGPITQMAVKTFQKDQKLSQDGIVRSPTWEKLIMTSDAESRGSQVSALQDRLQPLHLVPALTIDGEFGPQTAEAVRLFRQKQHLQVKDVADMDMWCLLVGGTVSK
jgi:peptidoglycan hydrolase-like protein with peptidoglycan-binding domain